MDFSCAFKRRNAYLMSIQYLAEECQRLNSHLREAENDFNNEKMARRHWQAQSEQAQREAQLVKSQAVSTDQTQIGPPPTHPLPG